MQQKPQTANTTRHSTNAVDAEDRQGVDALGFGFSGSSNVYLLAHRTANLVKIGKANSILSRASSLGLSDFDLSKSIGLQVETEREAFDLERMLHTVFKAYRSPVEQVSSILNHNSGLTEWFGSDCLDRAHEFLFHINDIVPFKRVTVSIPARPEPSKKVNLSQKDRETTRQKEVDEANQINKSCAADCNQAFIKLADLVTFTGAAIHDKNSFEVSFSYEANGELVSDLLSCFGVNGVFHRPSGMTRVVGHAAHRYSVAGGGSGKFIVLRPLAKSSEGWDGDAIESLFGEVLDALRSVPAHQSLNAEKLFCISH